LLIAYSGDRRWVEEGEFIMQSPTIRAGLLSSAGDLKNETKDLLTDILNTGPSRGNRSGVDIDEI
jgi:hypothetical protein